MSRILKPKVDRVWKEDQNKDFQNSLRQDNDLKMKATRVKSKAAPQFDSDVKNAKGVRLPVSDKILADDDNHVIGLKTSINIDKMLQSTDPDMAPYKLVNTKELVPEAYQYRVKERFGGMPNVKQLYDDAVNHMKDPGAIAAQPPIGLEGYMGGTESGESDGGTDEGSDMDHDDIADVNRRPGLGSAADRIRAALFQSVEANPRKKPVKKSARAVAQKLQKTVGRSNGQVSRGDMTNLAQNLPAMDTSEYSGGNDDDWESRAAAFQTPGFDPFESAAAAGGGGYDTPPRDTNRPTTVTPSPPQPKKSKKPLAKKVIEEKLGRTSLLGKKQAKPRGWRQKFQELTTVVEEKQREEQQKKKDKERQERRRKVGDPEGRGIKQKTSHPHDVRKRPNINDATIADLTPILGKKMAEVFVGSRSAGEPGKFSSWVTISKVVGGEKMTQLRKRYNIRYYKGPRPKGGGGGGRSNDIVGNGSGLHTID